jgi:hypothetical protein
MKLATSSYSYSVRLLFDREEGSSAGFYRTTQHYITEDITTHGHRFESLEPKLFSSPDIARSSCAPYVNKNIVNKVTIFLLQGYRPYGTRPIAAPRLLLYEPREYFPIPQNIVTIYICDYRRGFDCRMDLLTTCAHNSELQALTELSLIYTLYK